MPTSIVLLTDFGTRDVYAGVMKGVISGIAPAARIVDLTHQVAPQDVRAAAAALLFAHRYFPSGSIFCCVVDPGVGTARDAVALELVAGQGVLTVVCPDNGLITPLATSVGRAVVLDDPAFHLPAASATFHGRDIFAPAAAHLAAGVPLGSLGSRMDPSRLVRLDWPRPRRAGNGWRAAIIHVDHFGNLITNLEGAELTGPAEQWRVRLGTRTIEGIRPTFAQVAVGEGVAYVGSSGYLELAIRQGNAAAEWQASAGDELLIERASG